MKSHTLQWKTSLVFNWGINSMVLLIYWLDISNIMYDGVRWGQTLFSLVVKDKNNLDNKKERNEM